MPIGDIPDSCRNLIGYEGDDFDLARMISEAEIRVKWSIDELEELSAKKKKGALEREREEWLKVDIREFREAAGWLRGTKQEDWGVSPGHNLYEVEIPDDNGSNYLEEGEKLTEEQADRINKAAREYMADIIVTGKQIGRAHV